MTTESAHTSIWRTFDVFFGIALVIGLGLEFAMPLSFMPPVRPLVLQISGPSAIVIGLALIVAAARQMTLAGQPVKPGLATSQIIDTGAFAISRNPIYLGGVLVFAGLAMSLDAPWLVPPLFALLMATQYLLILPEERYLAGRFKARYGDYSVRVRRWF